MLQSGAPYLEGLVSHKHLCMQSVAQLPSLEEPLVCLRVLAICSFIHCHFALKGYLMTIELVQFPFLQPVVSHREYYHCHKPTMHTAPQKGRSDLHTSQPL